MTIGTNNLFLTLSQHWTPIFNANWYEFTPFALHFEWERLTGGIEIDLCILNFRAYVRWNYDPSKIDEIIRRSKLEI